MTKETRPGSETGKIEKRVNDAVDQAKLEIEGLMDSMPSTRPRTLPEAPEEAPLELAERKEHSAREAPFRPRRRRSTFLLKLTALILTLVTAGLVLYLSTTPRDRREVAKEVEQAKKKVEEATKQIEEAVPRFGEPEYYTFEDDKGVVHIVDSVEKVPARYRKKAKRKD